MRVAAMSVALPSPLEKDKLSVASHINGVFVLNRHPHPPQAVPLQHKAHPTGVLLGEGNATLIVAAIISDEDPSVVLCTPLRMSI